MKNEKLTVEELIKPRYQVIADYPGSEFQVGYIVELKDIYPYSGMSFSLNGGIVVAPSWFDKYPHLFKKLAWYERRELRDMPDYVKVVNPNSLWEDTPPGCIRCVAEWKFNDNNKLICDLFPLIVNNIQLYRLEPATRQDYYLKTQTK